jgi:hypothetical protein
MNERLIRAFGFGGTGFLPLSFFKELDYHGKIRVWNLGGTIVGRPQSLYFDVVHIIGTHTLHIFKFKTVMI